MDIKITKFLSSLGMVRVANGANDRLNCLGVENPRQGVSQPMLEWKKLCSRIRLTAIFLHLRGTQVVGEQAAYAVGVNHSQFYLWSYKHPEVARLWDTDGDPLLSSLEPVFDLSLFLPKEPRVKEPARDVPAWHIREAVVRDEKKAPAKKVASKKSMPPHERRTVKTIHNLMSRLPTEVQRTIAKHFA